MRASLGYRRRGATRGYILITVLWTGLALLLAVSAFMSSSRQEALAVRAEVNSTRAVALARSGVNVALADLGRIGSDQPKSPRDGTPITITMAEGSVTYRIMDETGKIDVREATSEILTSALVNIAESERLDAFDAANVAQALGTYARGDRPATSVYDALTAAGLSRQTAVTASRYLTTLNFTHQMNPLTAPEPVLRAIPGLGPSDVVEILERRAAGRQLPRFGSATSWLVERDGPVYTIEAEARLNTGGTARVEAQVAAQGLSFRGGLMRFDILSVRIMR